MSPEWRHITADLRWCLDSQAAVTLCYLHFTMATTTSTIHHVTCRRQAADGVTAWMTTAIVWRHSQWRYASVSRMCWGIYSAVRSEVSRGGSQTHNCCRNISAPSQTSSVNSVTTSRYVRHDNSRLELQRQNGKLGSPCDRKDRKLLEKVEHIDLQNWPETNT